jgi:hypothetical protein
LGVNRQFSGSCHSADTSSNAPGILLAALGITTADVPELYLKQINGEVKKKTVDQKTKRAVFRWVQVKDNHAFDTEYYSVAAALMAGILRLD